MRRRFVRDKCGGQGNFARLCLSADDCLEVDGTEPSSDVDSDLFGLDWTEKPDMDLNSLVGQKDQARLDTQLLAFVGSGMVYNALSKTLRNEYPLDKNNEIAQWSWRPRRERTEKKQRGQRRWFAMTSAGNIMKNTLDVAEVRMPLI